MMDRYSLTADDFVTFYVDAIPKPQPRPRATTVAGHATVYEPKGTPIQFFRLAVREAAIKAKAKADPRFIVGPIVLEIEIVLPRPKRMMRKMDAPYKSVLHHKSGDIDNYAKAIMDAMDGIFWFNDCQVAELLARKWYAAGGERPHCRIMVGPARTERTARHER